jgi:DNA end-binding protein Ku
VEVSQFVNEHEIDPAYFEKPYFVVPDGDAQAEAFAVVRVRSQDAEEDRAGQDRLQAAANIWSPSLRPPKTTSPGMMAYTMRYAEELRNPAGYFAEIKPVAVEEDQLSLAEELIKRKSGKFDPQKFKDEYEVALRTWSRPR